MEVALKVDSLGFGFCVVEGDYDTLGVNNILLQN